MRAPEFWNRRGILPTLLSPLGALYASATARRVLRPATFTAAIPVICVGNINAGGTGKTPTVIALVEKLIRSGHKPFVVSRGYGGSVAGPAVVDSKIHTASDVGDEPLLTTAFCTTIVSTDRATGAALAQDMGANVILLDDGFQNPSVTKDLSIVVVDAHRGFGNGKAMPAGPLREPVSAGLKRANLVLSIGGNKSQKRFLAALRDPINVPHITAELLPLETGMKWDATPLFAFAGIGDPDKFFATLRRLGADLVRAEPLADHQPLTESLMKRLEGEASILGAQLVTTEKDAVRLPPSFRTKVLTLPVRLDIKNAAPLDAAFKKLGLGSA